MPLLSGSSSAEIDAPIGRCWELVQAIDRAPEWQGGLERVEVVERDPDGRPLICDTVSDARITKVRARVRLTYDAPHRLAIDLVQSEDVDAMHASWELEDLGAGRTRATYELAVDPGPVPRLARPLIGALRPLVVGDRARELARAVTRGR